MKNLRQKNPLLVAFRKAVAAPAADWVHLDHNQRIDLCVQFLLLPILEKKQTLTPQLQDAMMPSAVDLERQASALLAEQPQLFTQIRDLLAKTTALFLLPTDE
jgi:hypothetical protein